MSRASFHLEGRRSCLELGIQFAVQQELSSRLDSARSLSSEFTQPLQSKTHPNAKARPDAVGRKRNAASGTPHLHQGALACLQHLQGVGIAGPFAVLICSLQLQLPLSPRKEAACAAFHDKKISSSGRPEPSLQPGHRLLRWAPHGCHRCSAAGILRPVSSDLDAAPGPDPPSRRFSHEPCCDDPDVSLPPRTPLGQRQWQWQQQRPWPRREAGLDWRPCA